MGPARPLGRSEARVEGRVLAGLGVSMGNPHLVCLTGGAVDLDALDLTVAPAVDAGFFPDGVNVELVTVLAAAVEGADAHVRLRVSERGVGETRSCGTGACAAAYAALADAGRDAGTVVVDVPGGRLSVRVDPATTVLTGPAVVVAEGELLPGLV
jgi:diaminopimelate epimerase